MWDRTEDKIELVLIRHGETKSNQEHRYLGKSQEPLSTQGRCKLEQNRQQAYYPTVDYVFSSPMERCLETAEMLYPAQAPYVIEQWEEMDFGAFEGKNYQELNGDPRYQAWIDSNGTLPFPEGESREQFTERCLAGFQGMLKQIRMLEVCPHRVAAVIHGGTIMALLSSLYGGDYFDYQVKNGLGYRLCLQMTDSVDTFKITDLKSL